MSTVLDQIIAGVRDDLADRQSQTPLDQVIAQIETAPAVRDPMPAFRAPQLSIICEVKRSSPSKGHSPRSPTRQNSRSPMPGVVRRRSRS